MHGFLSPLVCTTYSFVFVYITNIVCIVLVYSKYVSFLSSQNTCGRFNRDNYLFIIYKKKTTNKNSELSFSLRPHDMSHKFCTIHDV